MRHALRIAMAVAVLAASVGTATAGDTALITVARKQVQGVLAYSAPSPVTAAMVPVGDEYVWIAGDLLAIDMLDPTKSFHLRLYTSTDGGATWHFYAGMGYVGDPSADTTQPIGVAVRASPLVGVLLRVEMDVPVRMALGFSAVITSALPF